MSAIRESIIFYFILFTLGSIGISAFKNNREDIKGDLKRNKYHRLKKILLNENERENVNLLFRRSELKINYLQYQLLRYLFFCICLATIIFLYVRSGQELNPYYRVVSLFALLLLTNPKVKRKGKKSLFEKCVDLIGNRVKAKKNIEVYRCISQLKNISNVYQEKSPDALFILEQLRKFTNKIRPEFNTMMRDWQSNDRDIGCDNFAENIGTTEAVNFAVILKKLDDLKPCELKEQLDLFQDRVRKDRETKKLKRNENISIRIYAFVLASAIIVILNFAIVAFYCDYINLMKYQ